jgi:hypothetical protein
MDREQTDLPVHVQAREIDEDAHLLGLREYLP